MVIAQIVIDKSQIAESISLPAPLRKFPGSPQGTFQPADTLARMLPQNKAMYAKVRVSPAPFGGFVILICESDGPGLPGFNVLPLEIKEGQTLDYGFPALPVQNIGSAQYFKIMFCMTPLSIHSLI